jgi:hypothetical protein
MIMLIFRWPPTSFRLSPLTSFLVRFVKFVALALTQAVENLAADGSFVYADCVVGRDVGGIVGWAEFCCSGFVEVVCDLFVLGGAEDFAGCMFGSDCCTFVSLRGRRKE